MDNVYIYIYMCLHGTLQIRMFWLECDNRINVHHCPPASIATMTDASVPDHARSMQSTGSMRVDPDAYQQLTWLFGDDKSQWPMLDIGNYGEMQMLAPHLMYHPGATWVSVQRVVANRSTERCPRGACCETDGCDLDHGAIDDDHDTLDDYANEDNYTYYSFQLGPAILANVFSTNIDDQPRALKRLGVKRGRTYASHENVHINLAYGPLISSRRAHTTRTSANEKLCVYWSLPPHERPDAPELSFSKRFLIKRWDYDDWAALDEYVDVSDWPWDDVEGHWARGILYLNSRDAPSDEDLQQTRRSWENGHREWQWRRERTNMIAATPPIPNVDRLRPMHAFATQIVDSLDAVIMKLHTESEPADLAMYLTSFLVQVEGLAPNRCVGWNKKVHKVRSDSSLHVTWRRRNRFALRPC
jgi:hypothetical protein